MSDPVQNMIFAKLEELSTNINGLGQRMEDIHLESKVSRTELSGRMDTLTATLDVKHGQLVKDHEELKSKVSLLDKDVTDFKQAGAITRARLSMIALFGGGSALGFRELIAKVFGPG